MHKRLEEEHIIPQWNEELVNDWGPFTDYIGEESQGTTADRLNVVTWLCRQCNKRLGKKFEEPASRFMKPMIRSRATDPQTMLLTRGEQITVGRWVIKTLALRSLVADIAVPEAVWDWLRAGGKPPPPAGTHVWIAKYPGPTQAWPVLPENAFQPVHEARFDWRMPRFHIGELATVVLHQRVEVGGVFTHPAEDFGMLARVLPQHDGAIKWPPEKRVGKKDLAQIDEAITLPYP